MSETENTHTESGEADSALADNGATDNGAADSRAAVSNAADSSASETAEPTRKRAKLSPLTVIGEVLVMVGLIIGGYMLWQPWYTQVVVAGEQEKISAQASETFRKPSTPTEEDPAPYTGEILVTAQPADTEVFGVLYVPAFGKTYSNVIAEGVSEWGVLNNKEKGIGRYPTTQLPGEPGNFAVAAHRSGPFTTPFKNITDLRVNDPIYVETAEGWYTYRFRSLEYVWPTEIDVLNPFPRNDGAPSDERILTLTTCHPKEAGDAERAIAYAVFESFQPTSMGPPAELVKVNPNVKAS